MRVALLPCSRADAGVALANSYRDVIVAVMCGSEIRLRHNRAIAVPLVRDCVNRMRSGGVQQPLTHQATWPEWCNEETPGELFPRCERWDDVASIVDFISQTTYSWWENRVQVSAAAEQRHNLLFHGRWRPPAAHAPMLTDSALRLTSSLCAMLTCSYASRACRPTRPPNST